MKRKFCLMLTIVIRMTLPLTDLIHFPLQVSFCDTPFLNECMLSNAVLYLFIIYRGSFRFSVTAHTLLFDISFLNPCVQQIICSIWTYDTFRVSVKSQVCRFWYTVRRCVLSAFGKHSSLLPV